MTEISHDQFVRLIAYFEAPTFPSSPVGGVTRDDWVEHFHACNSCSDAVLAYRVECLGINASDFACLHMAYRATPMCDQHPDRAECHDLAIGYNDKFDEYSIIKGHVSLTIAYCPWCGIKLPPSQRDRWFDELAALGVDPWSDEMPEPYKSGQWFKPIPTRGRF
jgi:hypothetical protein